jgi:TPR repeat protein
MANREELGIIRAARAGRALAQVELGKLYLLGSTGLPKSLPTALHWLERAACQECPEAWELIGTHIPLELARKSARPLTQWYERAFDAGVTRAGLVLAQLVLEAPAGRDAKTTPPASTAKALRALEAAAGAGMPEAQWLLSQQRGTPLAAPAGGAAPVFAPAPLPVRAAAPVCRAPRPPTPGGNPLDAQFAQAANAWDAQQWERYLECAVPLARAVLRAADGAGRVSYRPAPEEITLLSRCARLLDGPQPVAAAVAVTPAEVRRFWEIAAAEHDSHAQLALGLWYARMHVDGKRVAVGAGSANFKKANRMLTLAGEQGLAEAWYALSRIYIKPEFSQRNVLDAQKFLERAAEMGYRDAQLECGNSAWRARREHEANDVRAVYWLQKAAQQGCPKASAALARIAPRETGAAYTETGAMASPEVSASHPLLGARLELASLFNLSRAEALLIDVKSADCGHCLVIDIRASYGRSKRRLVLVESAQERRALDLIGRQFDQIDCGPGGPEGNYRQRLYRLKTVVPGTESGQPDAADGALDMAA